MHNSRTVPVIFAALLLIIGGISWQLGSHGPEIAAGPSSGPYMIAAANPDATAAAQEIIKKGGNAIDAAIAVQAVLTLVEPESSGLGGGAFMVYFDEAADKVLAYDGRETAPAGTTSKLFLDDDGQPLGFRDAVVSGRSVGVPGVVKMLWLAHQKHGALPWSDLFEPAIRLAENGFEVQPKLQEWLEWDPVLKHMPVAGDYFYKTGPDGAKLPYKAGEIIKNPAYARTLREIAEKGPDGFYEGDVAQAIVDAVQNAPARPGTLSLADLENYQAKERAALCRPYRIYRICTMPPPTSGGLTTLQTLGILESFDLKGMGAMTVTSMHFIAEAEALAYADRDQYIGDPDFVDVPVDAMLDPEYLASRAALIDASLSMGKAAPGNPGEEHADNRGANADMSQPSTSHFSIVDPDGNVVSMTTSVEGPFGSHLMAGGMILNNQLTDFSFLPKRDGKPVANAVAPGKRPRSSMDPVIVFDEDGSFHAAIGSPGGSKIINYVNQSLIAMLDWGMDVPEAIGLPHFMDRNGPLEIEKNTALEQKIPEFEQLGHEVKVERMMSGLHGILVMPDGAYNGGADPRRDGNVVSGTR